MSPPDVNHCGTCTACCRVYAIPDFAKPAGKWCDHCAVGKGCKIYATRPKRCVDFKCLWLLSQSQLSNKFGPELRPDKCKVVFAPSTNERIIGALTMPDRPDAWQGKAPLKLINQFLRAGFAVSIGPPAARKQLVLEPDGSRREVRMTEPDKDGMQWSIREDGGQDGNISQ